MSDPDENELAAFFASAPQRHSAMVERALETARDLIASIPKSRNPARIKKQVKQVLEENCCGYQDIDPAGRIDARTMETAIETAVNNRHGELASYAVVELRYSSTPLPIAVIDAKQEGIEDHRKAAMLSYQQIGVSGGQAGLLKIVEAAKSRSPEFHRASRPLATGAVSLSKILKGSTRFPQMVH